MANSRRILVNALILVLVAVLGACERGEEQDAQRERTVRPVKTMVLTGAEVAGSRRFPATVRAAQRVDIAFQVSGQVVELPVQEGQTIGKGGLVARLDAQRYRSSLQSARAEYQEARASFRRARKLVKGGFVSQTEFEQARARMQKAEAALEKARKDVEDTVLRSPFEGVVARVMVDQFQEVQAKEPVASIQDITTIELVVDAPERIVARRGQAPRAEMVAVFESLPEQEFPVTLKEFATEADPVTQTFEYVFALPQPENANLLPGMTASLIARPKAEKEQPGRKGFVLPASAVFAAESGAPSVWVVDPKTNKVYRRKVETGELTGSDSIRVLEGLERGDRIAVAGVTQLEEGMKVNPVEEIDY
ncbi:efflux RND transporter periplasmic adaptor subunit [Thiohalorhabdus methylotrophus]|uniref:Efflux RND transporter periplasmic adaptor subunit n=1 Tax=Thiohalorhabdus methylotrophus TaxID=3242694 RepID=A0ABV4TX24_9GAMM